MSFYLIIKSLHAGFRYIIFLLLIIAIVQSILGWLGKKPFTPINQKINLFTLISAHTQLLIGIVLSFLSPWVIFNSETMKNATTRYFTAEHWVMMVVAIALITIGYSKSKKIESSEGKFKTVSIFYSLAFVLIIITILAGHLPLLGSTK